MTWRFRSLLPLRALALLLGAASAKLGHGADNAIRPLRAAICAGGECPLVLLGADVANARIDLDKLCDQRNPDGFGYICNVTVAPACAGVCSPVGSLQLSALQHYVDDILSVNPFHASSGEALPPWLVPKTDLSRDGAFVFLTQRQALYLYLRTLALKMLFPNATVVSNETATVPPGKDGTVINALEYGLTYGCNWRPTDPSFSTDPACATHGMWSGVSKEGLQGNIFAALAWAHQLALESGGGESSVPCYVSQRRSPEAWCPHDSVIGAVRGGLSGPSAKAKLDTPAFWRRHARSLNLDAFYGLTL